MKTKVLEVLKPKAASFGFNEDELASASENIAGTLKEEATAEEIAAAVDAALPYLKLSQSAANRSIERFKTQFEKEHPTKTKEQEEAERKAKEEAERQRKEEEAKRQKEEPEWFKKYREDSEKRIKELEDANSRLAAEKTDSDFRKAAISALEGVDESYYALMLKSTKFAKQEDVDNFVAEVKAGWEAMSKKLKIGSLSHIKPPMGGSNPSDKPSAEVQARIERRKNSQKTTSPIRGLEK